MLKINVVIALLVPLVVWGHSAHSESVSTYGGPGLIDLPTAAVFKDGQLTFGISTTNQIIRNAVTFQFFENAYGTFRYTGVLDYTEEGERNFDRSLDLHFLLRQEDQYPAVAIGARDIIGTGLYASEYIVASKKVSPSVTVTAGLGWGRLAGENSFSNPLESINSNLGIREPGFDFSGGQFELQNLFRGETSVFAGVDWQVSPRLNFQLEFSDDDYNLEGRFGSTDIMSQLNVALQYNFGENFNGKIYALGGGNFGGQLNFIIDPTERWIVGGRESSPRPIEPRSSVASSSWIIAGETATRATLVDRFYAEGLRLEDLQISGPGAAVFFQNNRWDVEAQAAGRAARVLANTLPSNLEDFTVVFQERGVPISSVSTKRSDLEDLQYDYDAAWLTRVRADIGDANQVGVSEAKLDYNFSPYTAFSFFDPQSPIRADVGAQLDLSYRVSPGFTFDGVFRYPLVGNLGDSDRESDSVLPRVRSESSLFARESDFEINRLTAEYIWRPAPKTFARVTGGYLESQFGGISAEALWHPIDSRIAYGAEINYVRQRDFDMLFGFQDLDVVTGHVSGYYGFGNGFQAQLDLGRYLAGDWGGTLTVNREFNNGVRVGGVLHFDRCSL